VSKTPLEPPLYVTTKEAYHLLGVSRARFDEWRTADLISPAWYNGNRPMYLRVDVVTLPDRLPRGSKSVGPLLPPEDQALAKERAGEPDFNSVFTECFERLVPSLGEDEALARAIAHVVRLYRRYHQCDYKTARRAMLLLIESSTAIAPAPEPDFRRLYFERNLSDEEGRARAFEYVVRLYCRHHNCDLETGKAAVMAALKAAP
jgi:hypothetical protein